VLAQDKGVHREMESEGSRRQNLGLTKRKQIKADATDKFANQNEVQNYPKVAYVNLTDI